MDEAFEKLLKAGKNSVDNIIKWLKDAKIIDSTKEVEQKVQDLFKDVANKQNVELAKFKEALGKLAADQKKNVDELTKALATEGPKLLETFTAGASACATACKDALGTK